VAALLEVAGLVDYQHPGGVSQVLQQPVADVVADLVVVPHCAGQQVLQAVGAGLAGVLGDRPAVLAWQVGQQPEHQRPGMPSRLHPAEPAGDPAQQLLQSRLPAGRGYAVASGHRVSFGCPHTTGSSPVAALVCRPAQAVPNPRLTSKVTISGWSTKRARKAHQVLSQTLASAVDGGRLPRNVAAGIKLPKVQREEMHFLTAAQVGRFSDAA
jgi:hypothetical protein